MQIGERRFPSHTVAAFLPPGYTRTLLPGCRLPRAATPASAVVLHGRRLGWRSLRGHRRPHGPDGSLGRRALRRSQRCCPA
ncbi:MAG: hypothetical protein MZV49_15635 [Rhodopseudomonas palustris]|nr:hypothetical protein [Rhodopseudomonas palustris]